MADRLRDIKNMVEAMDGAFTAQLFGYEMNKKTVIEDFKWLIERAEKTEELEKKLRKTQIEIGRYSGEFQVLFEKQQNLYKAGLDVTRRMMKAENPELVEDK